MRLGNKGSKQPAMLPAAALQTGLFPAACTEGPGTGGRTEDVTLTPGTGRKYVTETPETLEIRHYAVRFAGRLTAKAAL